MVYLIIVVVAIVAIGLGLMVLYNRLVKLRNQAEEAWAQIDVQLTRRHDLIPNLVETVRGYADHERDVFTQVTEARSRAVAAGGVQERAEAEAGLTRALRSLFAVAENYPELKADTNFQQLQSELTFTEDAVAESRQRYNAAVRAYDTAREVFPTNVIAGMFNFQERPYFRVDDPESRDPVRVQF